MAVEGAKLYIDWAGWEVLATSNDKGYFEIEGTTTAMHAPGSSYPARRRRSRRRAPPAQKALDISGWRRQGRAVVRWRTFLAWM